eukprot:7108421-Pyramimonas_sp.AAC.1
MRKEDFIFAARTPTPDGATAADSACDVRGGGPQRILQDGHLRTPGQDSGRRQLGKRPPCPAATSGSRRGGRGGGASPRRVSATTPVRQQWWRE